MDTKKETQKHIEQVQSNLARFIAEINGRAFMHDLTKLESPEAEILEEYTPKLWSTTYGSEEYNQYLKEMKPMLDHHYTYNRHHPEHHPGGINGMTLIDLLEMLADWKAATLRHGDGNMEHSFKVNKKRYQISNQLLQILKNTEREFLR